MNIFKLFLLTLLLMSSTYSVANTGFPGRTEFPGVATIEKNELLNRFNDVIIVDTRSKYEFDTLRIKGAVNIPVANKSFVKSIKQLSSQTLKPIVFYCNGRSCYKSYKAVKKATRAGIKNTLAYDAGMFEWAKDYPHKAALLGKSPVNPEHIITGDKYNKHLISPSEFGKLAFDEKSRALILDIRDSQQRAASIGLFLGKEYWASIENPARITSHIKKAQANKQPIYIYDEVGKQVRWLQYALEDQKIKNYYFMDKGARGYIEKVVYNR